MQTDRVKAAFSLMGYSYDEDGIDKPAGGEVIYRKKHIRLHNRILKMKHHKSKHTYFDSDGNEIIESNQVRKLLSSTLVIQFCGISSDHPNSKNN